MIGADTTFHVQLEIAELPSHAAARVLLQNEILNADAPLALAPQVLSEFIHVVMDPKRFQKPLTMDQALARADFWWNAIEVEHVFPSGNSERLFMAWMGQHQLGRKRILDTQLAAIFRESGVQTLTTSNRADFEIFGFHILSPEQNK